MLKAHPELQGAGVIVFVGVGVSATAERALSKELPMAKVLSLAPACSYAEGIWRLRALKPQIVIALDGSRKLRTIALGASARARFVLQRGALEPIDSGALLAQQLRKAAGRIQRRAMSWPAPALQLPEPSFQGAGNDYRFLSEVAVPDVSWPKVTLISPRSWGAIDYPKLQQRTGSLSSAWAPDELILWTAQVQPTPELVRAHVRWHLRAQQAGVRAVVIGPLSRSLHDEPCPGRWAAGRTVSCFTQGIEAPEDAAQLVHRCVRGGAYAIALREGEDALSDASEPASSLSPKVSVYIPAYNAQARIERAIESALGQTLKDLEVCVCNDGSTDGTARILREQYASHPAVRVIEQPNSGIGAASNRAVRMCRGEFILQLDSDDELLPEAAQVLSDALQEDPQLALVYAGYRIEDPAQLLYERSQIVPAPYDHRAHLVGNVVTHPRMFRARDFHRSDGFDETLKNAVDFDIYLKLAEQGRVRAIDRVLYRYFIHGENTSYAQRAAQTQNHRAVIERALARRGLAWRVRQPDPAQARVVELWPKRPLSLKARLQALKIWRR